MVAWTLNFDRSGFFGFRPWRRGAKVAPQSTRAVGTPDVSQRRAEAMRGLFPKFSAWMARRAYLAEMGAVDRYLSQATDLFDLECRIRAVERGRAGAFGLD